ncbi:MAG: class I SAM-dependent methyltransferase [Treponema sp.]|nr:class I SAM-dependent methyltransferase [Treponema sp.]
MINKFIKYIGKNFGNPKGIIGITMTKIMNIMNQKHYSTVLDNIKLEPNNVILDIGFGNGYLIYKLFKKNIPVKIYGIEISSDMVNNVSKKNKQKINNGKLKLLMENINDTSFETNTFDKICTINTIYFWNNYEKCFSEIKRILKPNGIFINCFYSKEFLENIIYTKYGFNKYTVEEIIKMTEKNGLKIIKTIEIKKGYSYCIISEN